MANEPRYLTKSRFKSALECSTKLFYTKKPDRYYDNKVDDRFLKGLAKGGFQVGALAKVYFPGGVEVEELDYDVSVQKTDALLVKGDVTIYEAAFRYGNLFVRTDIIVRQGNELKLYEVKAKSIHSAGESLTVKGGGIGSEWKPFIYDIAFQQYVVSKSYGTLKVVPNLILVDTDSKTSVEGLNQNFFIKDDGNGKTKIIVNSELDPDKLGNKILTAIPVHDLTNRLYAHEPFPDNPAKSFIEWIHFFEDSYVNDKIIQDELGTKCLKCEFQIPPGQNSALSDGFKECWSRMANFKPSDFERPSVMNIWALRKRDEFIKNTKYFQSQLTREDLEPKTKTKVTEGQTGLSRLDRQWLQISKSNSDDHTAYIDHTELKKIMDSWMPPLHFIDFETTTTALPFNSGRRPYELIAFQFSHHVVEKNGSIKHEGQWFNSERGKFPNFDFVRALRTELAKDEGTIFRYATHENSVLRTIHDQLVDSGEKDKVELCEWINSVTESNKHVGKRSMVDLREIVLKYYYNPATRGNNSLKQILLAVLNTSDFLKSKYSKPIYSSGNFSKPVTWVSFDKNGVVDPYSLLPKIFKDREIDLNSLDQLVIDDEEAGIADGGAAMIAYAQMQFSEMLEEERSRVKEALLRYCELDSLAMVMLWEEWNNLVKSKS